METIGLEQESLTGTITKLKLFVEEMAKQEIRNENTWEQISWPRRYGALDINVTSTRNEAEEQRKRCKIISENLKLKLIRGDPSLPEKKNTDEMKKQVKSNGKRR